MKIKQRKNSYIPYIKLNYELVDNFKRKISPDNINILHQVGDQKMEIL